LRGEGGASRVWHEEEQDIMTPDGGFLEQLAAIVGDDGVVRNEDELR
jgi:hypothetical protein